MQTALVAEFDAEGRQFTYDAENKQVKVKDPQNQTIGEYFYNGDGLRIKKVVPGTGETTIFAYDASNRLVAEYSTVVEPPATAKTSYLTTDHLGSPRITTDQFGQVASRRDFMPYGEEIARQNYGADSIRQKFTTYERDGETDLDFAQERTYSQRLGRFTSADEAFADQEEADPQSWNLFVYVRNRPLSFVDPDGLGHIDANGNWVGDEDGEYDKDLRATWRVDPNLPLGGYWDFGGDQTPVTRVWDSYDETLFWSVRWHNGDLIRNITDDDCDDCLVVQEAGVGAGIRHIAKAASRLARGRPSKVLDKSMQKAGMVRPADYVAHHIVAHGSKKASVARRILKRFGIDVNSSVNGVYLPASVHQRLHTNRYYATVEELLRVASSKKEVVEILNYIRTALEKGTLSQ